MSKSNQKLANSLEVLKRIQEEGIIAIYSSLMTRTHRERLIREGFLLEVLKGWYICNKPGELQGETTIWYTTFWPFVGAYLDRRFGPKWCLSPEDSIKLQVGNNTVPRQLLVRAPGSRNQVTNLIHHTSIMELRAKIPPVTEIYLDSNKLRLFSLPSALVHCAEDFYRRNQIDARAALSGIKNASQVLHFLLEGNHSMIAGRLAGAFRNIGRDQIADEIMSTMRAAGFSVRETDPFEFPSPIVLPGREQSPKIIRFRLMWQNMRDTIIGNFPPPPGLPANAARYMKEVDDNYNQDAYNSLSIEGYQVTIKLIERVRSGIWNPDTNKMDREQVNAMAARGYWQAFQAVKKSIIKILNGQHPGKVVYQDHRAWYLELFSPSVTSGIIKASDLAGYRNKPVYIRNSTYTPPDKTVVSDLMDCFFELLTNETDPCVRVVLGHFMFVFIHPYTDGNGRMGRFLMNVMLSAGGYPWTIIPLEKRNDYIRSLEAASSNQDIKPFTLFLAELVNKSMHK